MELINSYKQIIPEAERKIKHRGEIFSRRGNKVKPRKYHMTSTDMDKLRVKWEETLSHISNKDELIEKSGELFFNPYRSSGAYFGGIQSLFLLGANEWHSYPEVRKMMERDMSMRYAGRGKKNCWEKFSLKAARDGALLTKDLYGKIIQNFKTLQRLGGANPYGYKLMQLNSCIDIRRKEDGIFEFRLNTKFNKPEEVTPIYDS